MNITWIGSPNYDTNRKPIKRIVIHWMAGNLAGTDKVFQDDARDTSAHYGVEDSVVHQYVKEEHVAYHAGNYAINQESIGIEHSASPDRNASEETYRTSAKLIKEICDRHSIPLTTDFIQPHKQFKATQCPGTIDIEKLIRLAKEGDKFLGVDLSNIEEIKYNIQLLRENERVSGEKTVIIEKRDAEIKALKGTIRKKDIELEDL